MLKANKLVFTCLFLLGLSSHANQLEDQLKQKFSGELKLVDWEILKTCSSGATLGRLKYLMDDIDAVEESPNSMPIQLRFDEFSYNSVSGAISYLSETEPLDTFLDVVKTCRFDHSKGGWSCSARTIKTAPYTGFSNMPAPTILCP